jgi:hypothetical protein
LRTLDGDDLGSVAHPVPNLEAGDLVGDAALHLWTIVEHRPGYDASSPNVLIVVGSGPELDVHV